MAKSKWANSGSLLDKFIQNESRNTLEGYGKQPNWVTEHANQEADISKGGYAGRQLFELTQNGADALSGRKNGGSIEIRLTRNFLYFADNGEEIDEGGVRALMHSHLSPKRGTAEIGRFGLGFKAVLGVTDSPEFFSRTGSFRFDRNDARRAIWEAVPDAERYPVLRLAFPMNFAREVKKDRTLRGLSKWARNIVRLPLTEGGYDNLEEQIREFPAEFLLFVKHVNRLNLGNLESRNVRTIAVERNRRECNLTDQATTRHWMLFSRTHKLSDDARADRRTLDDNDEVPIHWAAPLDRLDRPGDFWAFFPTMTRSLVAGILNAPWKTNEDRQNLLRGPFNEELIEAAAALIADSLPDLADASDPARHIDALPRRQEAGDSEQSIRLREHLFELLSERSIVPDQEGVQRRIEELNYPPEGLNEESLKLWADYPDRPKDWLHHKAITRNRLAAIGRLFPDRQVWTSYSVYRTVSGAPRATIQEWLEALVEGRSGEGAIAASMAAVQTAAALPPDRRDESKELGQIVLTADGVLGAIDPERLFLPDEGTADNPVSASYVHPALTADSETLDALKTLGIEPASPASRFRLLAANLCNARPAESLLEAFWIASRGIETGAALGIVKEEIPDWWNGLCARAQSGNWKPLHALLLPGRVVPCDGSRDGEATLDTGFHEADLDLLRGLGATAEPRPECELASEPWFGGFRSRCRDEFYGECRRQNIQRTPQLHYLHFVSTTGSGPLNVMKVLSEEGRARHTECLLLLEETYELWTMRHKTQDIYPKLERLPPALEWLKEYGRIRTDSGIVPFKSALGEQPASPSALRALRNHPMAEKIVRALNLADLTPEAIGEAEFIGEGDPTPLLDLWPGLASYLERVAAECPPDSLRTDFRRRYGMGKFQTRRGCLCCCTVG